MSIYVALIDIFFFICTHTRVFEKYRNFVSRTHKYGGSIRYTFYNLDHRYNPPFYTYIVGYV
jgi:hypothetical protein